MPEHLVAAVWIAALAGLRKGEVLGLARRHVDFDSGVIVVERALQEITGQGAVLVEPKTQSSNRLVAIPGPLAVVLEQHLLDHVGHEPTALLFTNSRGRPIRATVWVDAWSRMRVETGVDELRFHDLRHFAGTLAAQAGGTLKEVMERLGHSTAGAAMRYQHVAADRSKLLADRIGQTLE